MKIKVLGVLAVILLLSTASQSQITWSTGMNIASNSYSNMHPRIVVDGSGNPLVIWGRMSDESVFFSRWNGSAYTTPVKLNPSWLTVATASWMGPDIASHGDTIYVVMKQTPESDASSHIYISTSFDGGINFSSPVQVDFIADSLSRFPTVTTDASGNPIVGFMKFDPYFGDSRWAVTKSTDYGNTFSTDVKASGWSGSGALICDCCPGSICTLGNTVAMLYRNNQDNIRDTWVGISNDGGNTFSNGWNVDQNNWNLFSCPATGPDGVIIGDSLYSVFMNGASGTSRVYLSATSLSDTVAQPSQLVTGNIMGLASQNYPRIDKSGNAIAIVWKQSVNGSDQLPILFTNDINNGFPAQYDTVDLFDNTNADVALSNGNVYVVWEDDNTGTVKYRKGTYASATGIEENGLQNLFSVFPNPASEYAEVNFPQVSHNNYCLKLLDVLGNEMNVSLQLNQQNLRLDLSLLSSGMYFLTIGGNDFSQTQKLIIEK